MRRSLRILRTTALPLAGLLWAVAAGASGGRIPLSQPAVLASPGSYYLTQDIDASSVSLAFDIQASRVTLDLNGHTVKGASGTTLVGSTSGSLGAVRIAGGRLDTCAYGVALPGPGPFVLEDLILSGVTATGISLAASGADPVVAEVRGCSLSMATGSTAGIYLGSAAASLVVGNKVSGGEGRGIFLNACRGSGVRENVVSGACTEGIYLNGCTYVTAERNDASGLTGASSDGIFATSSNYCTFRWNTLANNLWRGLVVAGDYNAADWNTCSGNGTYGILVSGTGNVYAYNRTRSNGSGAISVSGTGNTDGGGNA